MSLVEDPSSTTLVNHASFAYSWQKGGFTKDQSGLTSRRIFSSAVEKTTVKMPLYRAVGPVGKFLQCCTILDYWVRWPRPLGGAKITRQHHQESWDGARCQCPCEKVVSLLQQEYGGEQSDAAGSRRAGENI